MKTEPTPDSEARALIRGVAVASLGTILAHGETGPWPYASLVLVACAFDGAPLLLLSDLAEHTKNLKAEPRVSLLFDGTEGAESRLAGARLSLLGIAKASPDERERARFTARHPEAEGYAGFADFHLYRVEPERAHLVAGFGRIRWVASAGLVTDVAGTAALAAAEPEILAHMNADHPDAVGLYATRLLGRAPGPWRMTGCDPEGADLRNGREVARVAFPEAIASPDDARKVLAALARQARAA